MESLPNPVANSGSKNLQNILSAPVVVRVKNLPKDLLEIQFDNVTSWLVAYRSRPNAMVLRAVFVAFRMKHLQSVQGVAKLIGVTEATWGHWEDGTREIRPATKRELVKNGWFTPQHFGLSASAQEIGIEVNAKKPEAVA